MYFFPAKKICILVVLILSFQSQLANARVSAVTAIPKLSKGVTHTDDIIKIAQFSYDDAVRYLSTYSVALRSKTMMDVAIYKELISEASSIKILTDFANYARRASRYANLGQPDALRKFKEYQDIFLKNIVDGKKINSAEVFDQMKQLRNGGIAGTRHSITGILFDKSGYPIFKSFFNVKLQPSLYKISDMEQFNIANRELLNAVNKNPALASTFSPENIARIRALKKPRGYTWHHSQEDGVLQLVETNIHQSTSHTGGRALWGGGGKYR